MTYPLPVAATDLVLVADLAERENHRRFLAATGDKVITIVTRARRLAADGQAFTHLLAEAESQLELLAEDGNWHALADAWVADARRDLTGTPFAPRN